MGRPEAQRLAHEPPSFASGVHNYQPVLSEGGLHVGKPPGIGGAGSVNHQKSGDEVPSPWLHRQSVPGEYDFRRWMEEQEEFSSADGLFPWCPLVHEMIVAQSRRGMSSSSECQPEQSLEVAIEAVAVRGKTP